MLSVMTQLFPESGPDTIGQFSELEEALALAMDRFQFGADIWIEEEGFVIITARELELRIGTEHPLA